MATDPNALPDSIVIAAFEGLKNTVSSERLKPGELERAINVDIDDVGQARRRRGQRQLSALPHHSLWLAPSKRLLVVRSGVLGLLLPDNSHVPLTVVGEDPVAYTEVAGTIYYSSRTHSGKILPNNTRSAWGATDGTSRWVSPVVRPTETLGPVAGRALSAPPLASLLEGWNGRLYMGEGRYIWATEVFSYDYVDKARNFLQFEADLTVLIAVDDGLYVGAEDGLHFLTGQLSKGLVRRTVSTSPIVRGSAVRVPADVTGVGLQRGGEAELAVMMLSEAGVLVCSNGGKVVNTTTGRVVFPGAQDAAVLHRDDSGVSSYLAVTRSGGGPATNARIGDHVDAEIRRAQGS